MVDKLLLWWQSLPEFYQQLIIAIIATIITLVLIWLVVFPVRHLVSRRQQSKREQEKKLRVHFTDLRKEAKAIMILSNSVIERYGRIVIDTTDNDVLGLRPYVSNVTEILFGEKVLPQPLDTFAAHFTKETAELAKYRLEIEVHNRKYEDFCLKIKSAFESKQIPVGHDNLNGLSPYVYNTIFTPLSHWWRDRARGKPNPWPNFKQIETKLEFGYIRLFAAGWEAAPIAFAKTEGDKEKCMRAIDEIVQSEEYIGEAAHLLSSADELIGKVKTLAHQLNDKLDGVDKHWPGTKNYRFRKLVKNCSKCKEIFG